MIDLNKNDNDFITDELVSKPSQNKKSPTRGNKSKLHELNEEKDEETTTSENRMVGEQRQLDVVLNEIPKKENIFHLKSKFFRDELNQGQQVRFITMGKVLRDEEIISEMKWMENQVVLVHFIVQQNQQQQQQQNSEPAQAVAIPIENQIQELEAQLNNLVLQRQEQQEHIGTYFDMVIGVFLGFVFALLALMGLCICPCSTRSKQGVMLGFIFRLLFIQAQLMQMQQNEAGDGGEGGSQNQTLNI